MSEKYKVIDSHQPTFITLTVIDWVDVFIRPEYTKILDESFNYCIAQSAVMRLMRMAIGKNFTLKSKHFGNGALQMPVINWHAF